MHRPQQGLQHITTHLAIPRLLFQPIYNRFISLHPASVVNKGTCEGKITRYARLKANRSTLE